MSGIVPRLDGQLAEIRLECLQLAYKLYPNIGLDAEDIVKAAATFSRYVIDGLQGSSDPACSTVATPSVDQNFPAPRSVDEVRGSIGLGPIQ